MTEDTSCPSCPSQGSPLLRGPHSGARPRRDPARRGDAREGHHDLVPAPVARG